MGRRPVEPQILSGFRHAGDDIGHQFVEFDPQHLGASRDHLTIRSRGKAVILPFLLERLHRQVVKALGWADQDGGGVPRSRRCRAGTIG